MKVFFGGTLPRFEEKKQDYLAIRNTLLNAGVKIMRDWIKEEVDKIPTTWNQRWDLVNEAMRKSDGCILDCTLMDVYVGEQLAMIVEKEIPLLLLVDGDDPTVHDSPLTDYFISKDHLKFIQKRTYTQDTLEQIIKEFLGWVKNTKRLVRFNLEIEKNLDDFLKEKAKQNNTSKSEEIRKLILHDMKK